MTTTHTLRRLLAAATLTTGLTIGFAATANATPEEDFLECAADHPDDIGVCCVFYGGTYDEKTGECWDYPGANVADPGPGVPPKRPGLTRVPLAPLAPATLSR